MQLRLNQAVIHLHGREPAEIKSGEITRGVERQEHRAADAACMEHTRLRLIGSEGVVSPSQNSSV